MDIPGWLADTFGDITIGQIIIWVVLIVLIIIGARRAWPALKAIVQFADTWAKLPKFMADTDTSIAQMKKQILNNHPEDSNMREEITEAKNSANRAVELAEGMHGRMDALEISNDRQEKKLADVDRKLLRDHQRLGVIEETLPKSTVRELTEQAEDDPDR
jgi:hypothetical protein